MSTHRHNIRHRACVRILRRHNEHFWALRRSYLDGLGDAP